MQVGISKDYLKKLASHRGRVFKEHPEKFNFPENGLFFFS